MMAVTSRLLEKKVGGENIQSDAKLQDFLGEVSKVSFLGKKTMFDAFMIKP